MLIVSRAEEKGRCRSDPIIKGGLRVPCSWDIDVVGYQTFNVGLNGDMGHWLVVWSVVVSFAGTCIRTRWERYYLKCVSVERLLAIRLRQRGLLDCIEMNSVCKSCGTKEKAGGWWSPVPNQASGNKKAIRASSPPVIGRTCRLPREEITPRRHSGMRKRSCGFP